MPTSNLIESASGVVVLIVVTVVVVVVVARWSRVTSKTAQRWRKDVSKTAQRWFNIAQYPRSVFAGRNFFFLSDAKALKVAQKLPESRSIRKPACR